VKSPLSKGRSGLYESDHVFGPGLEVLELGTAARHQVGVDTRLFLVFAQRRRMLGRIVIWAVPP